MATENNTNNKNVTVAHLKKSLERAKAESDKALSSITPGSGETATDEEIDAMLNEVFGTSDGSDDGTGDGTEDGSEEA